MSLRRLHRWLLAGLAGVGLAAAPVPATAQEPNNGVEVLARGPVHEAFATTVEFPAGGGPVVPKAPPDPIEELPPDQKPDGENVQWVPGYWHWDEERTDFIWISGFWRVPPPGRVWVPGGWREARGGFQWVNGFWEGARVQAQRAEIEYLPPPPAPIEVAPSVPAPSETHTYVPGSWVWRNRYVWRPGFWVDHRPGWVWVPAHYRWTPAGYVFIDGYWDMPLAERGVLFAPVYVPPAVYVRPAYVYTPTIVVNQPCLYTSLFVRRGWGTYYFGDYFEARYVSGGFTPWCGAVRSSGFAISIGFGRGPVYDPLWDYYRVAHRHDRAWVSGVAEVYSGRFAGSVPRPPRTLVQQNVVINNITNNVTNVTNTNIVNNTTVVNNRPVPNNVLMLTSLQDAGHANPKAALKPIPREERVREQQFAQELRGVSAQRKQLETNLADRGLTPAGPAAAPKAVKLDVPKAVVARAQVSEERKAKVPPAPALVNVKQPVQPPAAPKAESKPLPPPVSQKADSKPAPALPSPKLTPKADAPKPLPAPAAPKADPKPPAPAPVNPPKGELKPVPKGDSKQAPPPAVVPPAPKGDPKPAPPPAAINPPKVDKLLPPASAPTLANPPKVEPRSFVAPAPKPVSPPAPVNLAKPDAKPAAIPPTVPAGPPKAEPKPLPPAALPPKGDLRSLPSQAAPAVGPRLQPPPTSQFVRPQPTPAASVAKPAPARPSEKGNKGEKDEKGDRRNRSR